MVWRDDDTEEALRAAYPAEQQVDVMQRDHTGLALLHIIVRKSDSEKGNLQ